MVFMDSWLHLGLCYSLLTPFAFSLNTVHTLCKHWSLPNYFLLLSIEGTFLIEGLKKVTNVLKAQLGVLLNESFKSWHKNCI